MSNKKRKDGFMLIEILMTILVIAVLVTGGGAVLWHAGISLNDQQNKRLAIDQAIARLEMLKRADYLLIRPDNPYPDVYYVVDSDQDDLMDVGELFGSAALVEGAKAYDMITSVVRMPGTATESEYLVVAVEVTYNQKGQTAVLESLIVPDLL